MSDLWPNVRSRAWLGVFEVEIETEKTGREGRGKGDGSQV
jgi:hypothetical protein